MGRDRAARPEAKPLRLFVAIEIPDHAKDVAEEAFAPWREEFPKARWVPRENMHVTLKFLGRTWPRLVDWVPERPLAEAAAEFEPFETRLHGVGSFPSAKRGRAIWAGLEDDEERLTETRRSYRRGARGRVRTREAPVPRPPHDGPERPAPEAPARTPDRGLVSEPWTVDHVTLFQSHLGRPAPRYEPLERFPLGG